MVRKVVVLTISILTPVLLYAQWSNEPTVNTVISDTTGDQVQAKIVVNQNGESFISWFSAMVGLRFDVYMQRLGAGGNKLWTPGGLLISNKPTNTWTTDYGFVLDRDNCAVLVNQDTRTGYSDVFAYRISPDGNFLWGPDGIQLTDDTLDNFSPSAVALENGDVVFAWSNFYPTFHAGKSSVGLQRISPAGDLKWGAGITIGDSLHNDKIVVARSEDDNIIVAWCRFLNVDSTMHILVQKMDSSGSFMWPHPVQVDTGDLLPANSALWPQLENDGTGGVFVYWNAVYSSNANTVFVQHIDASGTIQWPINGIEVSTQYANSHSEPQLLYLPTSQELFVFWKEYHYDGILLADFFGLYGQQLSVAGARVWGDSGKVFEPLSKDTMCWDIAVKEGPGKGVTVFYEKEYRRVNPSDTSFQSNIMAMRLDEDGSFLWPEEKVALSTADGEKLSLAVGDFVHNQWIGVWTDSRNSPDPVNVDYDIYAQNINVDGTLGPFGIEETTQSNPPENLLVSHPNPFHNRTTIQYGVSVHAQASLKIYDPSGRLVKRFDRLTNQPFNRVTWDASRSPAGIYFVCLETQNFSKIQKLILLH